MIESVDNLSGLAVFGSDGKLDLDLEDSGSPTFYLNVVLPDGRLATSGAITFA